MNSEQIEKLVEAIVTVLDRERGRGRVRTLDADEVRAGLVQHFAEVAKRDYAVCTRIRCAVANSYKYQPASDAVDIRTKEGQTVAFAGRGAARKCAYGRCELAVSFAASRASVLRGLKRIELDLPRAS